MHCNQTKRFKLIGLIVVRFYYVYMWENDLFNEKIHV